MICAGSSSSAGIAFSGSISVESISIFDSPMPVGFSSHCWTLIGFSLATAMTGLPAVGFSTFAGSLHPVSGSSEIVQSPVGGPFTGGDAGAGVGSCAGSAPAIFSSAPSACGTSSSGDIVQSPAGIAARISDARMPPERCAGCALPFGPDASASASSGAAAAVGCVPRSVFSSSAATGAAFAGDRTIGTGATGVGWRGVSGGVVGFLPRGAAGCDARADFGSVGGAGSGTPASPLGGIAGGTIPSGCVSNALRTTGNPIDVALCFASARGFALSMGPLSSTGVAPGVAPGGVGLGAVVGIGSVGRFGAVPIVVASSSRFVSIGDRASAGFASAPIGGFPSGPNGGFASGDFAIAGFASAANGEAAGGGAGGGAAPIAVFSSWTVAVLIGCGFDVAFGNTRGGVPSPRAGVCPSFVSSSGFCAGIDGDVGFGGASTPGCVESSDLSTGLRSNAGMPSGVAFDTTRAESPFAAGAATRAESAFATGAATRAESPFAADAATRESLKGAFVGAEPGFAAGTATAPLSTFAGGLSRAGKPIDVSLPDLDVGTGVGAADDGCAGELVGGVEADDDGGELVGGIEADDDAGGLLGGVEADDDGGELVGGIEADDDAGGLLGGVEADDDAGALVGAAADGDIALVGAAADGDIALVGAAPDGDIPLVGAVAEGDPIVLVVPIGGFATGAGAAANVGAAALVGLAGGDTLGVLPRGAAGIDGTAGIAMRGAFAVGTRIDGSPITTHSASEFAASMRPLGAGGTGRGSAGIVAGRGATVGGAGLIASRAFSSSPINVLLGSSGSTNFTVMPGRPWSTVGFADDCRISASPSIITPPSFSVTAMRPRRPAGSGDADGMNKPVRSA